MKFDHSKFLGKFILSTAISTTVGFSTTLAMEDEVLEQCYICLNENISGTRTTRVSCDHRFCTECIKAWLKKSDKCPICRKTIQNIFTSRIKNLQNWILRCVFCYKEIKSIKYSAYDRGYRLNCGHIMCGGCLRNMANFKESCPICSRTVSDDIFDEILKDIEYLSEDKNWKDEAKIRKQQIKNIIKRRKLIKKMY